ncbi:ring canal kelch homolog [Myzus persicae]|uniref:ring canal kelch homolog n=1 Tax=Myzus persicae TaxID=13164 RepID=UPI000B939453|nr:ring canal kelch homolog [Myzus persicae]
MQNLQGMLIPSSHEISGFEYYKKSPSSEIFEVLQSLRNDEVFCDIKLETGDGTGNTIFGHKIVLSSACPYFYAMFTHFEEKDKDLVVIKQLDSITLQLIVDFIYSGKIMITENNVQTLLSAANLMQLQEIKEVCCHFLQKLLHPTNCLGINALADLHSCMQLLISSKLYIKQNFAEVVESDEFLSIPSEQVIMLISGDELTVPSEEKVFECVIRWVRHELDSRKCILPQLMEYVRLPLTSENYLFQKVVKEPVLNYWPQRKYFIMEALHFNFLKRNQPDQLITVPEYIRIKPRRPAGFDKIILVVGGYGNSLVSSTYHTEWYDPKINRWQFGPAEIVESHSILPYGPGLAVLNDRFVYALGGTSIEHPLRCVRVLDLSSESPSWKSSVAMLVKRGFFGVGVINNYLYAVGGYDGTNTLNSAEVFDYSTQAWRMVSSMSTKRADFGVGVLNNLLYAVGGCHYSSRLCVNSVECYNPCLDTWEPVAEMCKHRHGVGVGVLDGVLYAVGGRDLLKVHKSAEAYSPSTGVWTSIADMYMPRQNAGVVALYGLLYVIGGNNGEVFYSSVESYNPISNTWLMLESSMNLSRTRAGVVAIDRPPHF